MKDLILIIISLMAFASGIFLGLAIGMKIIADEYKRRDRKLDSLTGFNNVRKTNTNS